MNRIDQLSSENHYLSDHAELVLTSFARTLGRELIDHHLSASNRHRALFEAPFALLSHNTDPDPVFNYGNRAALKLFEMEWDDFIQLPSRLSAEEVAQEERNRLLKRVTEFGFIDDYKGMRVSSTGKRFMVEDAIVWNMVDSNGVYQGQAAVLFQWSYP